MPSRRPFRSTLASLVLLTALLLAPAAPALAETHHWVTYQAGVSVPTGDLADDVFQGYGGGIGYEWMRDRAFGLGGEVVYRRWRITDALDRSYETAYGQGVVAKLTNVDLTLHATAMLPVRSAVRPFVQAGGGLYCTRDGYRIAGTGDDTAGNHLGVSGGAGVQIDARPQWSVRALATVHRYSDGSRQNLYGAGAVALMWRMPWGTGPRW